MQTDGSHALADIWLVEYALSNEEIMSKVNCALDESGMTVLGSAVHDFGAGAFTGVWLLAESHFSVHTFPERNYISVDCYTCGDKGKPMQCINSFVSGLVINNANVRVVQRGVT